MSHPTSSSEKFANHRTVTIYIGVEGAAFHIHEDLLCRQSIMFSNAFRLQFRESTDRTMTLPKDRPEDFDRFVQWLYNNNSLDPLNWHSMHVVRLYTLADKYNAPSLKRSIIHKYCHAVDSHCALPSLESVKFAYENLPEQDRFKGILAAWYAREVMLGCFDHEWRYEMVLIPDFAIDVMAWMAKKCGDFWSGRIDGDDRASFLRSFGAQS